METLVLGADVVVTEALEQTGSALRHVVAAGGVMCVDGAPGTGRTIALQYTLARLPPGPAVRRVPIPVGATVSQLRHAIAGALALKVRPDNRRNTTDQALATALRSPHVLVSDDILRLSPPALEYLCRLAADPGAPTTLVLAGTGSTQALKRIPELASRILTRQHIPPLTPAQVQAALPAFHPLWGKVPPQHIARADERCARGNLRAFAQITAHVIDAVLTDPLAHSGSALPRGGMLPTRGHLSSPLGGPWPAVAGARVPARCRGGATMIDPIQTGSPLRTSDAFSASNSLGSHHGDGY
ncbi:AAA family ATPase [Streptomyces nojiriensis]|uniref:AAA family ATPase n=1 Tax=Streptomyces nojiriensis TaxID=66374 RepID=UPI0036D99177